MKMLYLKPTRKKKHEMYNVADEDEDSFLC